MDREKKIYAELADEYDKQQKWGPGFRNDPMYSDYTAKHPNPRDMYSLEELKIPDQRLDNDWH